MVKQSKKDGNDEETIQSSTTPDPGYHMGNRFIFKANPYKELTHTTVHVLEACALAEFEYHRRFCHIKAHTTLGWPSSETLVYQENSLHILFKYTSKNSIRRCRT